MEYVYKICAELRPGIIDCLNEFDVPVDQSERDRVFAIARQIEEYDIAGMFAYAMYGCLLAAADPTVSDKDLYAYYEGSLGKFMKSDELVNSFDKYMKSMAQVAGHDGDYIKTIKVMLYFKDQTFEERAIMEMRKAFIDSDIFARFMDTNTRDTRAALSPRLFKKPKVFYPVLKALHASVRSLAEDYLVRHDASQMMAKVDEVDDTVDEMVEFVEQMTSSENLSQLKKLVGSMLGDDLESIDEVDAILDEFVSNGREIIKGEVYIRKIALMVNALNALIFSGRMSLDENKILAHKIKATVNVSAQAFDKNTGILKLDELDISDIKINVN